MPLPLQQIGAVDAGRPGAHQHLSAAWAGNRPGRDAENLGSAGRCDIDTAHELRNGAHGASDFLHRGQAAQRERVEVGVNVEGIHAFPAFQPGDSGIGERRCQRFVDHLDQVRREHEPDQGGPGDCAGKGDEHDKKGIEGLADDGGSDGAGPQPSTLGEDLEPGEGEGVGKLAHPVGDQAGGDEARYQPEDCFEGLLVMPSGVGGEGDGHGPGGAEQGGGEEADPDGAPRRLVAIDLGKDVAEDIGNGEEQFGAADGEGPQAADLLGDQVRYQQDNNEDEHQRIEIFEARHPSAVIAQSG